MGVMLMVLVGIGSYVRCGRTHLYVCPDPYLIAWQEVPPYTKNINGTPGGLLLDTFKAGKF